jgi:hypothetical protein
MAEPNFTNISVNDFIVTCGDGIVNRTFTGLVNNKTQGVTFY